MIAVVGNRIRGILTKINQSANAPSERPKARDVGHQNRFTVLRSKRTAQLSDSAWGRGESAQKYVTHFRLSTSVPEKSGVGGQIRAVVGHAELHKCDRWIMTKDKDDFPLLSPR